MVSSPRFATVTVLLDSSYSAKKNQAGLLLVVKLTNDTLMEMYLIDWLAASVVTVRWALWTSA